MMWLTKAGLTYGSFTALAMILTLALGVISYLNFPKREDPAITVRTAIVIAANPGLRLEQLEELVALPLEETARAIEGVEEVRTQLTDGKAILQVDIQNATQSADLKRVFDELRDDVAMLDGEFPDGTWGPTVNTDFGDVAITTIALTGDGFTLPELEDTAKDLRDRLYLLEGVASVKFYGVQSEVVTLLIDRARLAAIGTTLEPVLAAIQGQNVQLPSGSVVLGNARVPLETTGDLTSIKEIEALMVDLSDVGLIRLGDLFEVRRELEQPSSSPVFENGQPAIVLGVEMAAGIDITDLGPDVRDVVNQFIANQPIGIEASFSTFQPQVVEESVNNAMLNMAQTFGVVFLVMFFFLGLRVALVVAAIVPFAVSFAFSFMGPLGVELQQVSIAAIIISLGILVDNGVVIVEDMQRRVRYGAKREKAALAAGAQYAIPLLVASATTIAAFLPLFLLEGTEGEYGYALGVVVMLMLVGSFLSASYFLPCLACWLMKPPAGASEKVGPFTWLSERYASFVRVVLKAPLIALTITAGIALGGIFLLPSVPQQLFPLSERPQFLAYIDLPSGTDISETEKVALRFSDWLVGQKGVVGVTTYIGDGGPRFVLPLDPADTNPSSAFIVVNTVNFDASIPVLRDARNYVQASMPEAMVRLKRLAEGGREAAMQVRIAGPDADVLMSAAQRVRGAFSNIPALIENRDDWGAKQIVGTVAVHQDRLRAYSLSSRDVADGLAGFFDGARIGTFRDEDDRIPILLRGAQEDRANFDALRNAAIEANGDILALDQLADLSPRVEFSSIRRLDQVRTVTVTTISEAFTAYELLDHIQQKLDELTADLGSGYNITIGGEVENSAEIQEKLSAGAPIAIGVILLALMAQFNSFRRVFVVLATVPLVVAGVGPTLLMTGHSLSFFGTLGMIALAGIIINNAIVLIDQIDIERQSKMLNDAIVDAARKRLRPIVLTSMTTVVGLLPMAIAGGALWESMAVLMMGGLGSAALLALVWVPALYRIVFRSERASVPA